MLTDIGLDSHRCEDCALLSGGNVGRDAGVPGAALSTLAVPAGATPVDDYYQRADLMARHDATLSPFNPDNR